MWEAKVDWDDPIPPAIEEEWLLWRSQLKHLCQVHIPRCYFPKQAQIVSFQLHGFSDASENAYARVVYLRMEDSDGVTYTSLVASKTRVAPIKRLSIPRLELCAAHLLTKLLEHVRSTLKIPIEDVFAWTDTMIVVNWLDGSLWVGSGWPYSCLLTQRPHCDPSHCMCFWRRTPQKVLGDKRKSIIRI